ncbi:hypothetical protein SAMN05216207_106812 [Pseudonocardia ammonioxydans]|uniref:Uncharacterized protein n=1 Tax=Pseudonocardia ammonioxydans TaxID=260086 RepID=A0A1I5HLQ0_PSUAM|nr:hypothetical protein [Pseudonocardia ammonioxydans]SFO48950.1 hypothetical protein SAMN05216207_106812 [Pseudonocardia ammonioxydans]
MSEPDVACSDGISISPSTMRDGDDYVVNGHRGRITATMYPTIGPFSTMQLAGLELGSLSS